MARFSRNWQKYRSIHYFLSSGTIDDGTHVPGLFAQSSAESDYNTACTAVMALAHFIMLMNELLNRDTDIVPE